jgi:pimeloyl-ACP methyl ester carboxylesterase
MRRLAKLALLLGLAYLAVLAALWFGQERLLFQPTRLDPQQPLPQAGGDVHETWVDVPGARLSMLELRLAAPRGVVFFLHGNAGSLQSWFVNAEFYRRAGYDLVMPDYRGYGKSSSRIESEAQLIADMRAAWQQVAARYAGRRVVLLGRSLGTGLAAALAADIQPDLTVLVSPYESMLRLAREQYPWVPAQVLRYPLRTDERLARVRGPILMLHGERDTLIPIGHAQALQARAPHATLVSVPGAGHNDVHLADTYKHALAAALDRLR